MPRFIFLTAALLAGRATVATAHSGNSGIRVDQETVIEIRDDVIAITYTSQLNRQGAYLEVLRMDLDGDGALSPEEQTHYFARLSEATVGGLELRINDEEIPLRPVGELELSMPFIKCLRFEIPHPADWKQGAVVELHNDNYLDFPGAITITIDPGTGADILYDSRWQQEENETSVWNGATLDPQQRDIVFRYGRGTGRNEPSSGTSLRHEGRGDTAKATPFVPQGRATRRFVYEGITLGTVMMTLGSLVCIGLGIAGVFHGMRAAGPVVLLGVAIGLGACFGAWTDQQGSPSVAVPDDVEAAQIFQRLHRNIYRAFDAQTESDIYDTLALGLQGDVLDEVYNEVYEALLLRGDGSTQFNVRRVKPIATEVLPRTDATDPAFHVKYRWRVYGTVTHLGHTHARFNEYEATYGVQHNGRAWRISDSQVRQHKRVTIGQT
ncbi:MAG: hypothetical protein V3R99_00060 [Thermoguttaceae bacterium]